tara:strand:- start:110 stop:397 length:288 start_codon:yes stop_codon:yes gene_type:complete
MASFDLSILGALQSKFESLQQQIKTLKEDGISIENQITTIDNEIGELEKSKLDLTLKLNEKKEEELKLSQLFEDTSKQYELVKSSASQLLSILET